MLSSSNARHADQFDELEQLFDYESVMTNPGSSAIEELQQRVLRMQSGGFSSRQLETLPALREVVQLRTGGSYAVDSPALAMALMAGPSSAGEWSAVVGAPEFGYEAAAGFGVDLRRVVVVPAPGEQWLSVTAGLIDVATVVVIRPPARVTEHQAERIRARLRQKDATLICWGDWPRCEARISTGRSQWAGLGAGHGRLTGRRVEVQVRRSSGPGRLMDLWLPGTDQQIDRVLDPVAEHPASRRDLAGAGISGSEMAGVG